MKTNSCKKLCLLQKQNKKELNLPDGSEFFGYYYLSFLIVKQSRRRRAIIKTPLLYVEINWEYTAFNTIFYA